MRRFSITLKPTIATILLFATANVWGQPLLRPSKNRPPVRSDREEKKSTQKSDQPPPRRAKSATAPMQGEEGLATQVLLDAAGYSPGIIDGMIGPKTVAALTAFQADRGIKESGEFDAATKEALGFASFQATRDYTFSAEDAKRVGECPTDWRERARAKRLPFATSAEVVTFEGHCTRRLLERLNPGVDLDQIRVGQTLKIPNVQGLSEIPTAQKIRIDFGQKQIHVLDKAGNIKALFHCSIAKQVEDRPTGPCDIRVITEDPEYLFRPESWPEVKGIDENLVIPAGPRNPVGVCWIGLSIKGYGIHGTPEPEMIGKTGSHGCFRLTNWDVLRLSKIVRRGMHVDFVDSGDQVASR